jgi:hypothetical protein
MRGIRLEGLDQLHKDLEKVNKSMFEFLLPAAKKGAQIQKLRMKANAPKGEGELMSGIDSEAKEIKSKRTVIIDTGVIKNPSGKKDFFAKAASVEYGHAAPGDAGGVKVAEAKSYQRSALDETKKIVNASVKADLEKAVKQLGR